MRKLTDFTDISSHCGAHAHDKLEFKNKLLVHSPGEAPPVDSQPPPDILPVDPPPPVVEPPPVVPPPPIVDPPIVSPPPPVVDPPIVSPPPPLVDPPIVSLPPPPVVDPPIVSPPPPPVVDPPIVSPPPPPVVDPPIVSPPLPPVVDPPIVSPPPPPVVDPPIISPPPPPVVDPPIVSPPPPVVDPPIVSPPPPVAVPPVVSPPPPVAVPPVVSSPPPPDVVPPPVSPPPPPDIVPPPVSPPPLPDVVPPPVSSPPPPDALPPTESPPPPPDALPPTESPPPPPDVIASPPPPPPRSLSPPLINSPPGVPSPNPPSVNPKSPPSPAFVPPPPKSSTTTPVVVGAALGSVALLLAVFGLFWFLYGYNGVSGQSGYPPSGQQLPASNGPPSPLAPSPSMSSSVGFSATQPHQSSTNGTVWSDSSGTDSNFLSSGQGMVLGSGTIAFTYDDLKIATNGFSNVNLLGQGGFGYVHKGMLPSGKLVAVKSLKADSGQGEREFHAEVETISRVHHKHLVTLVGYCITDSQKLLVYEFVENKTMEFHLHGKGQPVMDWPTRLKIAVGAAKGLAYLHEDCHPKIIHRDIKAANILLDHTFEAQVADFGLAKFSSDAHTHISTRVMGTFGYLAPEYASSGQLSEKSDVFSFGVLLLELITGRRPVDFTSHTQMEDCLVDWARPLLAKAIQDGNFDPLIDPRLEKDYDPTEMGTMIICAASCVRHSAKRRPRMSQIVRALEGNLALSDLNDGVKPGFSALYSSADIYEAPNSEDTLRFRRTAYGNEESSEFSVTRN
ncbi:hypothetical protein RND81_07G099700 [Saponaria officinalis]|uniref:non-specific serine/threonine protein kinase n=1 Tax=Saponaria officinalis TaxID=3572 RepID=A0AAW1JPJ4_SAPOF